MRRRLIPLVLVAVAGLAAILFVPVGRAVSQEISEVRVTNFPDPQNVRGSVSIEGPVALARFDRVAGMTVSPVRPEDTTRLADGGILQTAGFPSVVLSLNGQVKGEVTRPGTVGAILVPEIESVRRALNEEGQFLFSWEVTAPAVSNASPYFASNQPRFDIAFPRYHVYFYNTSDRAVTVNLYAYLTN